MSYTTDFPDFGTLDVSIPADWTDASYRNDTCPSFAAPTPIPNQSARVYIDYADATLREFEGEERFNVYAESYDGPTHVYATDDWPDALAAVEYVRTLPDLRALSSYHGRTHGPSLLALAKALDLADSWNDDGTWTADDITDTIAEGCRMYVSEVAFLAENVTDTRAAWGDSLDAMSVQWLHASPCDSVPDDEVRASIIARIVERAAELRIPANLIGA